MINGHGVTLAFGAQKIFDEIGFSFTQNQRIGLVGLNGSGKSTLLKAIARMQELDSGNIACAKNKKIAYMPQEVVLTSDKSILQETFSVFSEIERIQKELDLIEPKIETSTDQQTLERYIDLQEKLAEYNPSAKQAETKKILMGLGFLEKQFDQPVDALSVGWKMRIILAKLLLQKADFYLFDEPTNHLDIVAKDWFLSFLQNASFGFVIVCHERHVLNLLCSHVFELEYGKGIMFNGNYSTYEQEKEHRIEVLQKAHANQEKEIKRKQRTIDRFRAKSSKARMAQSMQKQLDKIERIELPISAKQMAINFGTIEKSGRLPLQVKNLSHAFGTKKVFDQVNFTIERGQKVAIVAPNGVGKTTLFNLIVNKLPVKQGSIEFGYKVTTAIFDQDQTKVLNLDQSVFDNALAARPEYSTVDVRSFLGSFLFSNDEVKKQAKVLSGGEKNRLGMVRTLLKHANLLLLDEPTNHLDIPSKDILLKALKNYEGTMLFVSHDHDFINKLATHIIELTPNGTGMFEGNYEQFLYYKRHLLDKTVKSPAQKVQKPQQPKLKAQKKSKTLERKVLKLEKAIQEVENSFAALVYGTPDFDAAQKQLTNLKKQLDQAMSEWENSC